MSDINGAERYGHRFNARLVARRAAYLDKDLVRVLDAGCGKGQLMLSILEWVPMLTGKKVEVYGFDVSEHGVQDRKRFEDDLERLGEVHPAMDWRDRIRVVSEGDPWPFTSGMFDIVVSNQVLEHVRDGDAFFEEHGRVLKLEGSGLHCFPTKHVIKEQHVCVPWAHRIKEERRRAKWMRLAYALGSGRRDKLRACPKADRWRVAKEQAEYVSRYTCYRSMQELESVLRKHGMICSYEYTPQFYTERLRERWSQGRNLAVVEGPLAPAFTGRALAAVLRYLASVVIHVRHYSAARGDGVRGSGASH